MFNSVKVIAEAFGRHLAETYRHYNGAREPEYAALIDAGARLIVERIAGSDALYHDVSHTMLVTLVGQDILRGKLLHEVIAPEDWLHFTFALLCHDIGYVRGVCAGDTADSFVINETGERISLPRGASDAALTQHHVERGKIFVKERCAMSPYLDGERLARAIELTRFPVPDDDDHAETGTEPGLVRAADLIGQMADPHYLKKLNALYHEFVETGMAAELKLESAADLKEGYPAFFWETVEPYIPDALRYLELTSEGKQWIAGLYSHVFAVEHRRPSMGPFTESGPIC